MYLTLYYKNFEVYICQKDNYNYAITNRKKNNKKTKKLADEYSYQGEQLTITDY